MALFGLLGGGDGADPLDIYGDLFTDKQKAALKQKELTQGLFRMSEALAKAAQPSPYKPSIGSMAGSLGGALGAFGGGGDETMNRQLQAMKVGEDVRASKQQREWTAKLLPSLVAKLTALEKANGLPSGSLTSQVPGAGAAPAAAPAGAPPPATAPPGAPPAPVSMGLPSAGMSPFGLPDAPGAVPAGPPPVLDSPITPAERLEWQKTVGPGGPYLPIEDWVAKKRGGQQSAPPPPLKTTEADPNSQFAGLLSGGLDQVVGPDGQPLTGQGVLPSILASYAGTGGTPGGPLPFRLASSTPTESAAPGAAGADGWQRVKPLIRKYESGGRNIEQGVVGPQGGYNPSTGTVTGPSSASGYYQMLDSTWRSAARKAGIDTDKYPRAINAPEELQDKAAEALYREQGLKPWAPYNKNLAAATGYQGGGGDTVIPSGRGIPASALRNVADTGGVPGGIPGSGGNMPEQLSTLSAITQLLGLKDPFHSMLETYYKSPNYITESARARALGENDPLIIEQKKRTEYKIDTELKPGLEAAVAQAMNAPLKDRAQAQAEIDRRTKELEQLGAAGTKIGKATVVGDDGKPVLKDMTDLEVAIREKLAAQRRAAGDTAPRPGDIVGTPVLSPEETARQTQRGTTAETMREVQVWTPAGPVTQTMRNQEIEARRNIAAQRGPAGQPQVGDIIDKPVMRPEDQKIADALGEDFIALRRQAVAADKTIRDTHSLRSKLDSGMFTGLDANINLFLARLGDTMGWKNLSEPEKVKNTQTYIAQLGSEVLSMAQALKPVSNVDLTFLNSMAGGQNLSAASIRQLLDMREEYARLAIQRHNEEAAGRNPEIFRGARRELPMPPAYQPTEMMSPSGNRAIINR